MKPRLRGEAVTAKQRVVIPGGQPEEVKDFEKSKVLRREWTTRCLAVIGDGSIGKCAD